MSTSPLFCLTGHASDWMPSQAMRALLPSLQRVLQISWSEPQALEGLKSLFYALYRAYQADSQSVPSDAFGSGYSAAAKNVLTVVGQIEYRLRQLGAR